MKPWRRRYAMGSKPSENSMAEAVLNFLNLMPDTVAVRMETTGMPRRNRDGSFRMVRNKAGKGKPDIAFWKGFKYGLIELKMPGEALQPPQRLWHERFAQKTGAGACLCVCYGLNEVESFWRDL